MTATVPEIRPVALDKALRLINHGPTVLVSAQHDGRRNVMAAAWNMPLDFRPPMVCVVLDSSSHTRGLIEAEGRFALNLPTVAQAALTMRVGSRSGLVDADKAAHCGVQWLDRPDAQVPLVAGCAGWLQCRVLPQSELQQQRDLFMAEVEAAWADVRVFRDGHWQFDQLPPDEQQLRTLHYVAGGQFYATGDSIRVPADSNES